MVMVMFGDACAPSATASLPSSIARLYLPPPSPVRSNWYTAFMPFAAFALKRLGISLNTSGTFVACGRSAMGLPPFVEDVVVDFTRGGISNVFHRVKGGRPRNHCG